MDLTPPLINPILSRDIRRVQNTVLGSSPYRQYEYVDVTFNDSANVDTDIRHSLAPNNPEDVDYQVTQWMLGERPLTVPIVYADTGGGRRAWGKGYIVLRCNIPNARCTLLLTVRRATANPTFKLGAVDSCALAELPDGVIGSRLLVGPQTVLTSVLGPTINTIEVADDVIANGDRIYLEARGNLEFMAITSAVSGSGPYTYSVTRNLDSGGANTWLAGDSVFNMGTTGDGFIDLYSVRGVKSASEVGPTIVGNLRNSATYNDWSPRWAIGNLNGLYGYVADTYGSAFGDSANTWLAIDSTNGLRMMSGSTVKVQITAAGAASFSGAITASSGSITGGLTIGSGGSLSSGQTAYNTGTGFWLDYNGGTPRLSIGHDDGNRLTWDGSTMTFVGVGDGITSINGANITTGTINADKLNIGASTDNLIGNPGAENASLNGWGFVEGVDQGFVASTSAYEGAYSFAITNTPVANSAYGYRAIPLVPGRTYTVRLAIIGSGAVASGLFIRMNEKTTQPTTDWVTGDARTSYTDFLTNGALPASWTIYSYTYTVPAGVYWGSLSIYNQSTGKNVHWDAVEFRPQLQAVNIQEGVITAAKIVAGTITTTEIATGTIAAINIAALTITGALIAASTITADKISVTSLQAISASIGGFSIGATYVQDAAGTTGISSAVTGGDDIRFWAGHTTMASAPFRVTEAGALTATSATITGAITASSGSFTGGITIGTGGSLSSGQTAYDTGTGFWLEYNAGTPRFSLGNAAANKVLWDGTNVTVAGSIYIAPIAAGGGGVFANTASMRWTTDTTFRTAIWRSDTTADPYRIWRFDHIQDNNDTVITRTLFLNSQDSGGGTFATVNVDMISKVTGYCAFRAWAGDYITYSDDCAFLSLFSRGINSEGGEQVVIGVGTPPVDVDDPNLDGTLTTGLTITSSSVGITGALTTTTTLGVGTTLTVSGSGANTFGPGGTGTDITSLILAGGSGAAGGGVLAIKRNTTFIGYLAAEAALLGGTGNALSMYSGDAAGISIMVNHGSGAIRFCSGGTAVTGSFYANGDFYTNDGTVHSLSDTRVKALVRPFTAGLAAIKAIQPSLGVYRYRKDVLGINAPMSRGEFVSSFAQIVKLYVPEAVGRDDDGWLTMTTQPFIYVLMNSTVELDARVSALEAALLP